MKNNGVGLRGRVLKDMDKLRHDKREGFYDKDLDMYFSSLNKWAKAKWNVKLNDIVQIIFTTQAVDKRFESWYN